MTIGTILVPLLGDAGDGDSLAWAGALARRHHAHVTALHPSPNPSDALFALASTTPEVYITESMERSVRDQTTARRAAVKRRYTAWAEAEGVACGVPRGHDPASEGCVPGAKGLAAKLVVDPDVTETAVFRHALVADLVVTVLPTKGMERRIEPLNAALFDAGRPVLGVPGGSLPIEPGVPAVIAWNGSGEGSRALVAAVPLLADASDVVVVHAGPPDTLAALEPVVDYLARHRIKGRGLELGSGESATELLGAQIKEIGAGLVVMGAYSHSRLREFVLGGTTRDMLADPPTALLLSH